MEEPPAWSHAVLQAEIICLAAQFVVHVHACHDVRVQRGFPDLVLIGVRGILFRELKVGTDSLSSEQRALGYKITAAGGDFAVWTPEHLGGGTVLRELGRIGS